MEQWRCVRINYFKSRLWNVGETVSGNKEDIPRHFVNKDNQPGEFGKKAQDAKLAEPKINLEEIMKDSPLLEKAKHMSQMNKAELCAMGRSLGIEFNPVEVTRAEMIKDIIEAKDKRGTTNQELADLVKG